MGRKTAAPLVHLIIHNSIRKHFLLKFEIECMIHCGVVRSASVSMPVLAVTSDRISCTNCSRGIRPSRLRSNLLKTYKHNIISVIELNVHEKMFCFDIKTIPMARIRVSQCRNRCRLACRACNVNASKRLAPSTALTFQHKIIHQRLK